MNLAAICYLLISAQWSTPPLFITQEYRPPFSIQVAGENGKMAFSIKSNGQVVFGEGFAPDEATLEFVKAMERLGAKWGCKAEGREK
jgi:hypothetical protein